MNQSQASQFSVRYALPNRKGNGIGCAICGELMDRPDVLAIFFEAEGLPPRPVCPACSSRLCPHLHGLMEMAGMIRTDVASNAAPNRKRDDWYPVVECAVQMETVQVEDVPATYNEAKVRDVLDGETPLTTADDDDDDDFEKEDDDDFE
jgi:hypothetical protein